jgi:hypothetical protein
LWTLRRQGLSKKKRQQMDSIAPTPTLGALNIPLEVREFCKEKQIEGDLAKTIDLAHQHFTIRGRPWFQVVHDPEAEEHYVSIHIGVAGAAERVFEQGEAFLDSFGVAVDRDKHSYITLVYHSI